MLKSPRDLPLVLSQPDPMGPLLTVENYCKWYDIYIVFPDGRIEKVPYDLFWLGPGTGWNDHVPNPKACQAVAKELNAEWDGCSLEMIVGRYMLQVAKDKWEAMLKEMP